MELDESEDSYSIEDIIFKLKTNLAMNNEVSVTKRELDWLKL